MADERISRKHKNRMHFDEIPAGYDHNRPEYPIEMLRNIVEFSGCSAGKIALEIGAGTGKATAAFLASGYRVTAVEIGENMAAFLTRRFEGYKNFSVIVSPFEDAPLKENYYDLVYAASAFHWVDASIGCKKVFRLLKPGGVFALLRYKTIPSSGGTLYEEIQAAYEKYYYPTYPSKTRPVNIPRNSFKDPDELKSAFGFSDMEKYGFEDVAVKLYDSHKIYSEGEYISLLDTFSDHRALPKGDKTALYEEIKDAILRHGGQHRVDYVFQLFLGRKQ